MYLVIILLCLLPLLGIYSHLNKSSIFAFFTNRLLNLSKLQKFLADKTGLVLFLPLLIFTIRVFPNFAAAELGIEIIAYVSYYYMLGLTVYLKLIVFQNKSKTNKTVTFKTFIFSFCKHIFFTVLLGLVLNLICTTSCYGLMFATGESFILIFCGFSPEMADEALKNVRSEIRINLHKLTSLLNSRHNMLSNPRPSKWLNKNLDLIEKTVIEIDSRIELDRKIRNDLQAEGCSRYL